MNDSYNFTNILFWINFLFFIIAVTVSFYIPGRVIIGKIKLNSNLTLLTISFIVGLVLWAWQGFIFGILHLRFLTYLYLISFLALYFKNYTYYFKGFHFKNIKIDLIIISFIIVGTFTQVLQLGFSGFPDNNGIRLFLTANDDGLWHVALTNQLIKQIPPNEPGMNGVLLTNYHYLGNLVNAELLRIFHLPALNLHFQYMNIFLSLFLGLSGYITAKEIFKSNSAAKWFTFLLYFGGDLIYLITLFTRKTLEFGVHPLEDGTTFLENPPRAFSIIIALIGVYFFSRWLSNKIFLYIFIAAIMFGSVIGFKVYSGILVLFSFGCVFIFYLMQKKFILVLPFLFAIVLSIVIFFSDNSGSGGFFLDPFWHPINFIVQDKLGLQDLELRRRTYMAYSNYRGIITMEIVMTLIFLVSQYGTRILGFMQTLKSIKYLCYEMSIFLFSGIFVSLFFGLFFLQVSGTTNSFNFFLSASLFLTLLTSYTLSRWQKIKYPFILILLLILVPLINFPRIIYKTNFILQSYKSNNHSFYISSDELNAFKYLKFKTPDNSVILVDNKGSSDYLTPYVSFFSNRPMYLSGQNILASHNVDINKRQKIADLILKGVNYNNTYKLLKQEKISYIYFAAYKELPASYEKFSKVVFQSKGIFIIKIF